MPDTLAYLIACLILFGVPVAAFFFFIGRLDKQTAQALLQRQKQADDEFLQSYGQEAFSDMIKVREDRSKLSALDTFNSKISDQATLVSQPTGFWFCPAVVPTLFQAIVDEFQSAPIGTPPYRWHTLSPDQLHNQITLQAEWPDPIDRNLTTLIDLELTLVPWKDGRTALLFKHNSSAQNTKGTDPFATQIIKLTNTWLKNLCTRCK